MNFTKLEYNHGFAKDKKVLLLGFARSGTSSMIHLVNGLLDNGKKIIGEPFNPNVDKKRKQDGDTSYLDLYKQVGLEGVLNIIEKNANGFKHLYSKDFDKYVKTADILKTGRYNIIYLYWKNALKNAVSLLISYKSTAWSYLEKEKVLSTKFKPFNAEEIESYIFNNNSNINYFRNYMKKNNIPFLEISYEDVFGDSLTKDDRRVLLSKISEYIGGKKEIEKNEVINNFINNPFEKKLNNLDTYKLIPNIDEINLKLGQKYGYLYSPEIVLNRQ